MSLLNNNFLTFGGESVTGRVPTQMIVYAPDGYQLSEMQQGAVSHVYKLFCDAVRVSVAGYHVQNLLLPDGTKVRMESINGVDKVMVWPVGGGGDDDKMPHGFAVRSETDNWLKPFIYGLTVDEDDRREWKVNKDIVPQAKNLILGTTRIIRKPEGKDYYMVLPLVYGDGGTGGTRKLFDYWAHGAKVVSGSSGSDPVTPVAIAAYEGTGLIEFHKPHLVVDGKVRTFDQEGNAVQLYAHEPPTPILLVEPEDPHFLPALVDSKGDRLVLSSYRRAIIAPTFPIGQYKFKSEKLKLLEGVYVNDGTVSASLILKPQGENVSVMTNTYDYTLDESPEDSLFVRYFGHEVSGGVARTWVWRGYDDVLFSWDGLTYWGVVMTEMDTTPYRSPVAGVGFVQKYEETPAENPAETALFYVGKSEELSQVKLQTWLKYPITRHWRGGWKEAGLLGWPGGTYYGVFKKYIGRYNSEYKITGTPEVYFDGWETHDNRVKLLSGTANSILTGHFYLDREERRETLWGLDYADNVLYTPVPYYVDPDPPGPYIVGETYSLGTNSLKVAQTTDMKPEFRQIVADYSEPGPGKARTLLVKVTRDEFVPPDNTIDYDLSTIYLLDYDGPGCFWAGIKVRIESKGARWGQVSGAYKGCMEKKADPTYTITISFVSAWKNPETDEVVRAEKILQEPVTATRPMFEATATNLGNPYTYPIDDQFRQMVFYVLPKFALPYEAGEMFEALATPQGVNPHFVGADHRPDITGDDAAKYWSDKGIEYSYLKGGREYPHGKRARGMLYARDIKPTDLSAAAWLLIATKCNAPLNNQMMAPGADEDAWHYFPAIKEALEKTYHIELRDGVLVDWSSEIYEVASKKQPTERKLQLYEV